MTKLGVAMKVEKWCDDITDDDIIMPYNEMMELVRAARVTEQPRRQRLHMTQIMTAFRQMTETEQDLENDRIRLLTDMSYAKSWQSPAWLMCACTLGDCQAAGALQYVARPGDVCTWCTTYALQNYM